MNSEYVFLIETNFRVNFVISNEKNQFLNKKNHFLEKIISTKNWFY